MATITETLNTLYTTTWAKRRAKDVDQIFEENRLLQLMKSKGMIKMELLMAEDLRFLCGSKRPRRVSSSPKVQPLQSQTMIH
jgi:hypothetical protein